MASAARASPTPARSRTRRQDSIPRAVTPRSPSAPPRLWPGSSPAPSPCARFGKSSSNRPISHWPSNQTTQQRPPPPAARRPPKHCLRRIPTPPSSCCYTIPPPHALQPQLYHALRPQLHLTTKATEAERIPTSPPPPVSSWFAEQGCWACHTPAESARSRGGEATISTTESLPSVCPIQDCNIPTSNCCSESADISPMGGACSVSRVSSLAIHRRNLRSLVFRVPVLLGLLPPGLPKKVLREEHIHGPLTEVAVAGLPELPQDVLVSIFAHLEIPDLMRACSVCSSWRSAYSSLRKLGQYQRRQTPCLLYTSESAGESVACLYSLLEKRSC
ncbi:hypothetical protein ZWY2020_016150 [Hordeum vulgare]|nr:hypothetical protein ZWY2020_016150 [Hordeum vulgare]